MEVEKIYDFLKTNRSYFQDVIYVALIGRRVIPTLEIGWDAACYTTGGVIHLGAACPAFQIAENEDELFASELYVVFHEIAHRLYTVNKEFSYAYTQPIKPFAEYAARKVLHKHVRLVKEADYMRLFSELCDAGYYITMESLQTTFHYVANSIEDGRIEGLLGSSKATFKKLAKAQRLKTWYASPVTESASTLNPDELTATDKLNLMLNQILYVSTSYRFQKGFASAFAETKMFDDISDIIPSLKESVSSRSCKPAMIEATEVSKKLFDYILDASTERNPYEELMKELLTILASLDGDSEFILIKSEEETGDEDSKPLFADDDRTENPEKSKGKKGKSKDDSEKSDDEDSDDSDGSSQKKSDDDSNGKDGKNGSDDEGEDDDSGSDDDSDSDGDGQNDESKDEGSDGDSSNDSGTDSSDDDSDGNGESEGKGDDSSDDGSDDDSEGENSDGGDDSSSDEGSDGKGESDSEDDSDEAELKEAEKQAAEAAEGYAKASKESGEESQRTKELMKNDEPFTPAQIDLSKVDEVYDYDVDFREDVRDYKADDKTPLEIKNKGASLKSQISKILRTKKLPDKRGMRKGTVDGSHLSKLIFSDTSIFKQRGEPKKVDACAFLLQDNSGSMRWYVNGSQTRFEICCKSFAVIEEGFKDIMPLKIAAFSADSNTEVEHIVIKDFNEKTPTNLSYNFMTHYGPYGGNKDGYSIRVAVSQLLARHEESKILIIASDGAPTEYFGGEAEGALDVKNAVDGARKAGLTVIGIYIGNGRTIEAHSPSRGISYGTLSSFVRCGSPV